MPTVRGVHLTKKLRHMGGQTPTKSFSLCCVHFFIRNALFSCQCRNGNDTEGRTSTIGNGMEWNTTSGSKMAKIASPGVGVQAMTLVTLPKGLNAVGYQMMNPTDELMAANFQQVIQKMKYQTQTALRKNTGSLRAQTICVQTRFVSICACQDGIFVPLQA